MNKKLFFVLLSGLIVFILTSCGTVKLEDKQEKANYTNMKIGKFNAKYTNLDQVKLQNFYTDEKYSSKKAMVVYEKDNSNNYNRYNVIIIDSSKNEEIKTKLGNTIKGGEYIKINKAEVVPESLNNKNVEPTLLVNKSDIELISENKFQSLLESNKSYAELSADKDSSIFTFMMDVDDGELKYDSKYNDRVRELMKDYEAEKAKLDAETKNNNQVATSNADNIPQSVTSNHKAKFGQILEASQLNNKLTIKFKITPGATNKLTIDQNGFNVEDLITNQGASKYEQINYWAVADMTDGTENKVISFTVDKDLIQQVKNKNVFGQQIVDKAKDVWILPSLKK